MKKANEYPVNYLLIYYTSYGEASSYEEKKKWSIDKTNRQKVLMIDLSKYDVFYNTSDANDISFDIFEQKDSIHVVTISEKILAIAEGVRKLKINFTRVGSIVIHSQKNEEEFIKAKYQEGCEVVYFEDVEGIIEIAKLDL